MTGQSVTRKRPGKTKTAAGFLFLLFLVTATVWIVRFRGTATLRTAEGPIFGTVYHIKYEATKPLDDAILRELERVDSSLSVFNPQSTLSAINAGTSASTDAMLLEVLTKAREVSGQTDGAFDVTVMPLVNAWGFGFKQGIFPTDKQVDSLRQFVGYRLFTIGNDGKVSKKDARMMIDCGAIAKGYGTDRIAQLLTRMNVRNYMVEIGGEVVTRGRNPETGKPWKIGVCSPEGKDGTADDGRMQTVLNLENAALATSGNYNNYYERDGKKYAHTIDPRSGKPVQHSLLSATVLAPDCATADAYATAFMVAGMEKAEQLLQQHKELKAYFIYADDKGQLKSRSIRMPR